MAPLPPFARLLGFAGLLPQAAALAMLLFADPGVKFAALSIAYAYAALILSFLGGLWWGLAAAHPRPPQWLWLAAVAPSLFALASAIPWAIGGEWPGPSLLLLGCGLILSLLVDLRLSAIGIAPPGWMALRMPLSMGLGAMTVFVAEMA